MPGLGFLRKYGTVAANPENANKALDSGAALLVYPGGDYEVHRPSWDSAKVDFGGRKGFIRLALDKGVPIVPVVSIGGQETALFLSRGERLAKLLRLDKMFRLKVLPISLAMPWGLNVGDMLGHWPLPAKITIQVLEPIDLERALRDEAGPRRDLLRRDLRHAGHPPRPAGRAAAAARSAEAEAPCGSRSGSTIDAPREEVWEVVSDPANWRSLMGPGLAQLEHRGGPEAGLGRPLRAAPERRLRRDRRPGRVRGVGRAPRARLDQRHRASTSAGAGACARSRTGRART